MESVMLMEEKHEEDENNTEKEVHDDWNDGRAKRELGRIIFTFVVLSRFEFHNADSLSGI